MVENKKGIFISTVTQSIGRVIGIFFALLSVKILTNYLGTIGMGEYSTITTYINFFIVIADLGLFSVTVREISRHPEKEKKIISNVFNIRIISSLIACVIAGIIVFLTSYNDHIKFGTLIALGFLFFNLVSSVYDIIFQYRLKMQFSALAELISKFISLTALYIIVFYHGSFYAVVSTIAVSGIAMFVFKWVFAKNYLSITPKYDKKLSEWIIKAAIPLGAVFIVNNIFFKIDSLMLFAIKGAAAVGIYSVAYKVLEVTIFVGSYFASSLKPTLAQNIDGDKEAIASVINKAFVIMLILSFPIAITCTVFAREIIVFLSNEDFISGSRALVFLGFTLPLIYLDVLLGEILIAKDERKLLILIAISMLIINITLNLILIPPFSFVGAAIATLVSELILLIVNFYFTRRIIRYKINTVSVLKVIFLSGISLAIGFLIREFIPINFLFQIILTLLIYSLLLFLLNIVTPKTILKLIKQAPSS